MKLISNFGRGDRKIVLRVFGAILGIFSCLLPWAIVQQRRGWQPEVAYSCCFLGDKRDFESF